MATYQSKKNKGGVYTIVGTTMAIGTAFSQSAWAALGTEEQAAIDAAKLTISDYGVAMVGVVLAILTIRWGIRVLR